MEVYILPINSALKRLFISRYLQYFIFLFTIMSDKEKNPKTKEESPKKEESKKKEESPKAEQPKEESKDKTTEKSEDTPKTDTSKLESDLNALKGVVSGKDEKLKSTEERLEALEKQVTTSEQKSQVKDKLLDFDGPDSVKEVLKSNIDGLTPETFDAKAEEYTSIYNKGVEEQKEANAKFVGTKPKPTVPEDFSERVKNAKTQEELDEILAEQG